MSVDKIAALGGTALFRELDADSLRALAARAVERRFRKDELLFVAGEEALGLYVVVGGAVRAFRESADGRQRVIHVERAGATVAEVTVFDGGTSGEMRAKLVGTVHGDQRRHGRQAPVALR